MARRASARSLLRGWFLREQRLPFVRAKAKQRRYAVPAAAMDLMKRHWQAKSQARLRALLQANCQAWVKLVQHPAKPPLLEPQD